MNLSSYKKVFFFKRNKLCIPKSILRDLIMKFAYGGALAGHFNVNKILEILKDHFTQPKMGGDVCKVITRCGTCHMTKNYFHEGLYNPLLVLSRP